MADFYSQALQDHLAQGVQQVQWDPLAFRELKVHKEKQVQLDHQDQLDPLVQRAPLAHQDLRDLLDLLDHQAHQEIKNY